MKITNMLRRKLNSVFKQTFVKYLSTVPSPEIENDLPEEYPTTTLKENEILQYPDYFNVHNLFTVKDLFDAKVHYGHKISSLNRNMKPFLFGSRLGHTIFDLDITAHHLREALNFTAHIAYRDGVILFVSKNPRMTLLVEQTASDCKEYALTREWRLGLFTDSDTVFGASIRLPDLCILLNTLEENGHEHHAVTEAAKMCIPTIGIVDSNCRPNLITYPVPGNDDSYSCFRLYCHLFKQAILRGKSKRQEHLNENKKSNKENITDRNVEKDANVNNSDKIADEEIELKTNRNKNIEIKNNTNENKEIITSSNVNGNVKNG